MNVAVRDREHSPGSGCSYFSRLAQECAQSLLNQRQEVPFNNVTVSDVALPGAEHRSIQSCSFACVRQLLPRV